MELDNIYRLLGRPGRYHIIVFLLLYCNYFPVVLNHLAMSIYGATLSYQCRKSVSDTFHYAKDNGTRDAQCLTDNSTKCEHGWKYGVPERENNIITEWNLVCQDSYQVYLSTSIYFAGVMVGGIGFGSLSDRFGRRMTMFLTLFSQCVVGLGISCVQTYIQFCVLRFLQGSLLQGLQTSTFVLIMELSAPEYRTVSGTLFEIFWGVGVMWLAFVSYLLQNWRYIQVVISLPSLVTIFYICIIPESPRWLVSRGRCDEADDVVKRAARCNGVPLPPGPILPDVPAMDTPDSDLPPTNSQQSLSIFHVFQSKKLLWRTLILFYVWFTTAFGYYGLSMNVTSLTGNKYMNLFVSGAVETPAYCAAVFILYRFGRKRPLCAYFLIGGFMCLMAGLVDKISGPSHFVTILVFIGRCGMAGCFSVVLIYTCELYPTAVRNVCLGMCAFWARVGGVVAPQILLLGEYVTEWFPVTVFGLAAFVAGILVVRLPETTHKKMPDTLSQAEHLESRQNRAFQVEIEESGEFQMKDCTDEINVKS